MHAPAEVRAAAEQPPTRVVVVHIVPPATPTPQPVRQPHAVVRAPSHSHVAVHVPVAIPHVQGTSSNNDAGVSLPAGTAGPAQGSDIAGSPAPSPKPACSQPDVPARTIDAVSPSTPDDAAGVEGTAEVAVTLDATGRVVSARIYRSTNDLRLDRAAINAARQSTYAPALVDCLPSGGEYLFRVDFQS